MSTDNFQWTDELVLMIADLAHHNGYHRNSQRVVELFDEVKKQASGSGYKFSDWIKNHLRKQANELSDKIVYATPNKGAYDSPRLNKFINDEPGQWAKPKPEEVKQKDWEIVAVIDPRRGNLNVEKGSEFKYVPGEPILTVRRLPDGEVFSVGEETPYGTIERFYIGEKEKQTMCVHFTNGNGATLASLEKPSPQPDTRPPLGVMPEWRHKELRLQDIEEAVQRHTDVKYSIPCEWITETFLLKEWLKNREEEKAQPKQKERIEVASVVKIELPHDVDYKGIRIYSLHEIPEDKFPLIKAAIERILNNEITLDEVVEDYLKTKK